MSELTYEESSREQIVNINLEESLSLNINSLFQIMADDDSQPHDFKILPVEQPTAKVKKLPKKRTAKFNRQGVSDVSREKRDVKKYARYDTVNQIFDRILKNNPGCNKKFIQMFYKMKISKRSLRYFFMMAGFMKQAGMIEDLVNDIKYKKQSLIQEKYPQRSQVFKSYLNESLNYSIRALQLIGISQHEQAIKLAYFQNQKGVHGRTKNPSEMKKCQTLYLQTFLTSTTGQKTWI